MATDEAAESRAQATVDIVSAAQLADPDAFAALFRRFAERLRVWIHVNLRPALRRRISADDLLQETFLAAHGSLGTFQARGPGAFYAWLVGIAGNRIVDEARYQGAKMRDRGREVPAGGAGDDSQVQPHLLELAASVTTPSRRVGRSELQNRLASAIRRLPDPQQRVLVMRALEDRTLREIGESFERSVAWAHGVYAQGLRLLKRELGHDLER